MRDEVLMIPMAAIALPLIIVPIALSFRHAARKREFEHRERMKALETGQPVPGEANWAGAFVCASVGAGVPIGSFLFTWLASLTTPHLPAEIWMAPGVVSFFAIMGANGLARTVFPSAKRAGLAGQGKPHAFDPDAYDVAGSRG